VPNSIASSAQDKVFQVDLRLHTSGKALFCLLELSLVFAFAITSVDFFSRSPTIHQNVANLLYWGCGDSSIFQGQLWRLLTSLWLHGGLVHFGGTVFTLWIFWRWASKYYFPGAWFGTYIASGIICGLVFLAISPPLGHADLSHWKGPLAGYFMQPGVPYIGACGAVQSLFGMVFAALWRRRWIHKYPVVDIIGKHPMVFFSPFPFFFAASFVLPGPKLNISAQLVGMVVGFLSGMLCPMRVGTFIFSNYPITAQLVAQKSEVTWATLTLGHYFDEETDRVAYVEYYVAHELRMLTNSAPWMRWNEWRELSRTYIPGRTYGSIGVLYASSAGLYSPPPLSDNWRC